MNDLEVFEALCDLFGLPHYRETFIDSCTYVNVAFEDEYAFIVPFATGPWPLPFSYTMRCLSFFFEWDQDESTERNIVYQQRSLNEHLLSVEART